MGRSVKCPANQQWLHSVVAWASLLIRIPVRHQSFGLQQRTRTGMNDGNQGKELRQGGAVMGGEPIMGGGTRDVGPVSQPVV